MKDMGWIYLLLFVVLPLLKRFLDSRAGSKREESRRSTRQRSRRGASWPPSAAEDEDEPLTIAEMEEEEEEGWIVADPRPVASTPPPLPAEIPTLAELGGGWVGVPEVASGDSTTTIPEATAVRAARLPRADLHGVPPHPLDLLAQLQQQMGQDSYATDSEDPYQVDDLASDPVHGPDAYSLSSSARARHGRLKHGSGHRWRLSRSELRNRLVWREILGPPACLREPE
ncbi:MAG TPA: hypothetical protein EYN40_04420 [Planctomycetes bacterium]|nr:hypothetical protein [Planctomycetota bacterium]